jgi:NADH-quinone oxidoreductase subunit L
LGAGAWQAAIFHLMTHAFFKALLFLCAGAVIHNTGAQDIRQMGGLFGKMKITASTCFIACLAISGVPPLSGFWSKDEILLSAFTHNKIMYGILLLVAFMTAFYMFRLYFLTFAGKSRDTRLRPHESPKMMTWPLIILAVLSATTGLLGSPLTNHWFANFIYFHPAHHEANYLVMWSSIVAGLMGICLSWLIYAAFPRIPKALAENFKPIHNLLLNKYWFDEIYDTVLVRPFLALTRLAFSFDSKIIDGSVNGAASATVWTSNIKAWIDQYIVDGLVNLTASAIGALGLLLRRLQTGFIQNYLLLIFTSVIIIVLLKLI